ncbi:protein ALP1-like protein [Cinnamomum micranthum f. kanehirae]|uniref:Protein ALP1-like protein n=1 Tax=Cinnamomum micranthum f. kanehirae TaxID=337451 RepID=A0A443P2U0_9MAGN|nr:protein ALP1-like protein [Cinnamomum micranthum f. kanehirae]
MDQYRGETNRDEEAFTAFIFLMIGQYQLRIARHAIRDKGEPGYEFVNKVLCGHPKRCYDLFRMEKHMFHGLCNTLKSRNLLHDSKFLSVEEQVAIFLMTIGHSMRNRMMADRFQHSGETISCHFKRVLKAIVNLGKELITPPSFTDTPPEILNNSKYYPWFNDCVGAIDGTHVSASAPRKDQIPYRGRKVSVTENVMCACFSDMLFTFVYAGWEGTTNDSRVFVEAITNTELHFTHPPTEPNDLQSIDVD